MSLSSMDCPVSAEISSANPYNLLFRAVSLIPTSHYVSGLVILLIVLLYNFLELHFLEDLLSGFRGSPVSLTYNSCSEIYQGVVSKCQVLQGRYLATPWLSSPHFQTSFIHFLGRPPAVSYRRQLFHASDGGTFALDWLLNSDVIEDAFHKDNTLSKDDSTPIMVVIPGLTNDSSSSYVKHLAFNTAKDGWNVVVSNHRGLGGLPVTSDCFYNAGWTEDIRDVIDYIHLEYPKAALFVVGTSIGANILVKYLGEDGENVPIAGAAAICSPWDLLIGSRFISRKLIQKLYDRALTIGLQGYAKLHRPRYSHLADWEGIKKSRSIRDFDNYATCLVGKFETVDTYYRHCSSAGFVENVSVPLLCISALDDPVCTKEAIPWDECRANKNIVLVTTEHGGHLAFFEGITANGLWWVRAVNEFLRILHSSPFMHKEKKTGNHGRHSAFESSVEQGPYLNVMDGMVAAVGNEQTIDDVAEESCETKNHDEITQEEVSDAKPGDPITEASSEGAPNIGSASQQALENVKYIDINNIKRSLEQFVRQYRRSTWLLAYVAIISTWPLVGAAFHFFFKRRQKKSITC